LLIIVYCLEWTSAAAVVQAVSTSGVDLMHLMSWQWQSAVFVREFMCCLKDNLELYIIPRLRALVTGVTVVL